VFSTGENAYDLLLFNGVLEENRMSDRSTHGPLLTVVRRVCCRYSGVESLVCSPQWSLGSSTIVRYM